MAFRFKRSNCVLVGTFNMYIIQPPWLAKRGIIPKVNVTLESKLNEPGFRFSSSKLRTRWVVTPGRIDVESEDPQEDCGDAMAKVVHALPETPLIALGNNAFYEAPLGDPLALPEDLRDSRAVPPGYSLVQSTQHFALKRGESITNIQLAITDKSFEIATNVHTELRDRDSTFTEEVARRFLADRLDSERLITQLFNVRVMHDHGATLSQEEFHAPEPTL